MEKITYQKLYQPQDEVLNIVFTLENDFYLTGGTALHRFYYNRRYSDDLDLFYLAFHETFNWNEMIEIANKKSLIETDILLYRIKSFPLEWLKRIKKIEDFTIEEADIVQLVFDIQNGDNNTLYKRKWF